MKKKVKVMRVIARLNIGGPAIHAVLLTRYLNVQVFEPLLVCGKVDMAEGDMNYYALKNEVVPHVIPELQRKLNPYKDIIALVKIYLLIRKEKPDILHTHTAKAGTIGRCAALLYNVLTSPAKRVRLIHTFHGHVFAGYFNNVTTRFFLLIERLLARYTQRIIAVSESNKKELLSFKIGTEENISVIPLGFELQEFLGVPMVEKVSSACWNIGIVGRLVPIKNHRLFLEAAARILNNAYGLAVQFIIIGDGELRGDLKSCASRLGIAERVEFTGWQDDLAKVYARLDVVCLTSLNEGTPVSIIEAMVCARIVVATEVGGVVDLLGAESEVDPPLGAGCPFRVRQRGVTVASGDAAGFADAVVYIITHAESARKMRLAGRNFAAAGYTKERLLGDIEKLYKEYAP